MKSVIEGLVIGWATLWLGCGGESSPVSTLPGVNVEPTVQTPAAPGQKSEDACAPGLPAVSEVAGLSDGDGYAIQMVQSYFADVPILGQLRFSLQSVRRARFVRSGSGWELRVRICALALSTTTEVVRTIFPDAFVRSLPEQTRPVRFVRLGSGVGFCAPRQLEIRGAALADAENDPLPRTIEDARLVDQDGDLRPGLTVRVSGLVNGEIYVVQKDWNQLEGELQPTKGRPGLQGSVAWETVQVILGADNPILARQQVTSPDPESASNHFTFVPVDPGATCDDLAD